MYTKYPYYRTGIFNKRKIILLKKIKFSDGKTHMANPCLSTQKAFVNTASVTQGLPGWQSKKILFGSYMDYCPRQPFLQK